MITNRTTGSTSVVPELVYADVEQAIDWLCGTFGFAELWRADGHRARLAVGNGVVILADADPQYGRSVPQRDGPHSHAIMVKVDDVDAHHKRAQERGAVIVSSPTDYSYGERQYSVKDLAGHRWTFTQAIADLAPEDWGGTSAAALTGGDQGHPGRSEREEGRDGGTDSATQDPGRSRASSLMPDGPNAAPAADTPRDDRRAGRRPQRGRWS